MSHEYGWLTSDILKLTMREINWRIDKIISRQNLDMVFNAKIHGIDIKTPNENSNGGMTEFNENEEAAMIAAIEKAKERKALEYGRK